MVLLTVYIWPVRLRGLHKLPNIAQLAKQQSLNVSPVLSECFAVSKCPKLLPLAAIDYLLEFAQNHLHWIGDAIQPSHPLLPPSPLAFNLTQQSDPENKFPLTKMVGWIQPGQGSPFFPGLSHLCEERIADYLIFRRNLIRKPERNSQIWVCFPLLHFKFFLRNSESLILPKVMLG